MDAELLSTAADVDVDCNHPVYETSWFDNYNRDDSGIDKAVSTQLGYSKLPLSA